MLAGSEISPEECARLVATVSDGPASLHAVEAVKNLSGATGDAFERALLAKAAGVNLPRIQCLPLPDSVKKLLELEFAFYSQASGRDLLATGTPAFTTACKVISLRRFPAGPLDWEIGGFPRSWLASVRKRDLLRTTAFIATKLGGFKPLFSIHVARRPKNRSLVIQKEVLSAYYRMARSLELQPSIKGIMASAWFHDPAAAAKDPHLAPLSQPYLEGGGLIALMGPAGNDAGFLENNLARKAQLEGGALQYRLGVALWPRAAAMAWAAAHSCLDRGPGESASG